LPLVFDYQLESGKNIQRELIFNRIAFAFVHIIKERKKSSHIQQIAIKRTFIYFLREVFGFFFCLFTIFCPLPLLLFVYRMSSLFFFIQSEKLKKKSNGKEDLSIQASRFFLNDGVIENLFLLSDYSHESVLLS